MPEGERAKPLVELADLRAWVEIAAPEESARGRNRREHDGNVVGLRKVDHRENVVAIVLDRRRASVAGDIVRARHDVHHARPQRDDILAKPREHLGRGLSANASAYDAV